MTDDAEAEPETALTDPAFGVGPFKHRNASISARQVGISRAHWSSQRRGGGRFGSDTVSLFSQADSGFRGSDASGDDEFGELPGMEECPQFGLQLL